MTTQRDPNAIIAAWLDDGPLDLPGTTRRAIVTSLPITQQRRGLGLPWRLPHMNGTLRLILVAAALALAVAGIYVFSGIGGPRVGPAPSSVPASVAPPTVAPTPIPSPTGSPTAADLGLTGRIVFNRFRVTPGQPYPYQGSFVANADGSGATQVDFGLELDGSPVFSPDGTKLLLPNPFKNGKFRPVIANVDGTGTHRLEVPGSFGGMACNGWSPDATRILCHLDPDQRGVDPGIYSVRASDGGDLQKLNGGAPKGGKDCGGGDYEGDYSPDGSRYAFVREWCPSASDPNASVEQALYVGDATGRTTPVQIVPRGLPNTASPRWSPDGQWIAFATADGDLAVVHPDGTGYHRVVPASGGLHHWATGPDWSPDGQWLVFSDYIDTAKQADLYVIRPDSSGLTQITSDPADEVGASWGPPAP